MDSVQVLTWMIMGGVAAVILLIVVLLVTAIAAAASRLYRPSYRGAHTRAALTTAKPEGEPRHAA